MFETFSFLPPLSDAEIARQVEYIVSNGWSECRPLPQPGASPCLLSALLSALLQLSALQQHS
jgi:hypothetical protein